MCVGKIYTGSFFHFYPWKSVRVVINGTGKLDFLHISKLVTAKFFKHFSF